MALTISGLKTKSLIGKQLGGIPPSDPGFESHYHPLPQLKNSPGCIFTLSAVLSPTWVMIQHIPALLLLVSTQLYPFYSCRHTHLKLHEWLYVHVPDPHLPTQYYIHSILMSHMWNYMNYCTYMYLSRSPSSSLFRTGSDEKYNYSTSSIRLRCFRNKDRV